jgi:ribosome-associated translation inhibitor RaiA
MNIHIENDTQEPIPREHVMTRMTQVLTRLATSAVTARVTFSDVNGPKGGADIRCALLVSLPGRPPISAEHAETTARLAFDESYARVMRQLEHVLGRRQEASRRPKKYYAARRLLA